MTTDNDSKHVTSDLATLTATELADITGGDAGSDYTNAIKKDWKDFTGRAGAVGDDLGKHHYASAAGNFGNELVDEIKLGSDAVKPVKDLVSLVKW